MIDPAQVIARIQTLSQFRLVEGAAELATLLDPTKPVIGDGPNAYVVSMAEEPQPPKSAGGPQVLVSTFGVVIMVRRRGDALGAKTMNKLRPLHLALQGALLGWIPDTGFDPLFYRGGRLLHFEPSALWWQDDFSSRCGIAPVNQV